VAPFALALTIDAAFGVEFIRARRSASNFLT
jgi:hypothetical protein